MTSARDVLTPASLAMLQVIADNGSFAAAARSLHMVPSALTYRVRQIEDALDVLLFDRTSRQAKLTQAGAELLREGQNLLAEVDAIANRVKRVATGWEPQLTIAVDSIIDRSTVMELCENFFKLHPPTRLKLRGETLSGTLEALTSGQADLALGAVMDGSAKTGLQREKLGTVYFAFAVAPHHPLARVEHALSDQLIRTHRAVAIADSVQRGTSVSIGLLHGQDVFTVADLPSKLDAQVRGLGVGFLPTCVAQSYIDSGRLVEKQVERAQQQVQSYYVWRQTKASQQGRALQWWLDQLQSPVTRAALLGQRARLP
ncbi:LysR family transcriptional regulator [Undibacterium amnicola]|uniref:LysR family transcriptional regulator n=1 Tax=Undibacterium amnicola TaxID=1834038 RepID=A0ABR6XWF6_9BURK|nr:LysR substrate-binding domain-containing protein [Undibacterium amnicola]MBC3833334.1 LysR family transcriptional regulator [Undibacterium amnicola]